MNRKIKRTYSLEPKTVELIENLASETRRDFSAIVDIAIEKYARQLASNGQPQVQAVVEQC